MKTWMKTSLCIGLSFMFLFLGVGYAALTDTLRVTGTAEVDIPEGLFIIKVETQGESAVDENVVSYLEYTTTVDSLINRKNGGAGTVTYEITVLNNTRLTYSYRDLYYQLNLTGYNGNGTYEEGRWNNRKTYEYINNTGSTTKRIGVDVSFPEGRIVGPGQTLTFEATYTIGSGMDANTDWRTLINFQFGINVEGEAEALAVVETKFLDILNTSSTYTQLIDALDNKFDGRQEWTSNYIGNVTGSSSADSMAVNTLFAGQLQITVGTEDKDATVLIKHENLDGNTMTGDDYVAENESNGGVFRGYGCEMTLYLTIDPLTSAGSYVPVYAVVFTCDRDENGNVVGDWYRVGDTYAGEANVVTYDGGNGTGSFVTDNWRADAARHDIVASYNYTVGNVNYSLGAYSYTIANDVNIETIVMATDAAATQTLQTLLTHAKRIIDSKEYAGTGITVVEEAYAAARHYYTVDTNGNPIVNANMTRAQLIPAIRKLYSAVDMALRQMEALSKENSQP
ncbi:MAG: hypothetical protein E7625_06030 [Ruminococcaceae bacterium]|nr:hypothetical protein [Oscillospiraceae bacterium]